jgi:hypothetical protein
MKEVYLYGCEDCGTIKYSKIDKGSVWCVMCFGGCRQCAFHERVLVGQGPNLYKESQCYVEEKKDDNTDTRTDQKT